MALNKIKKKAPENPLKIPHYYPVKSNTPNHPSSKTFERKKVDVLARKSAEGESKKSSKFKKKKIYCGAKRYFHFKIKINFLFNIKDFPHFS
jgi:hypothetical protein